MLMFRVSASGRVKAAGSPAPRGGIFVRASGRIGIARTLLLLVIGAIIVALLTLIPWVGPWLLAIVLLLGIGAIARTVGGRTRRANVVVT